MMSPRPARRPALQPPDTIDAMIRYYAWAVTEKSLSRIAGGKALYRRVGRAVKHRSQGTGAQLATSFALARKARELTPAGGNVLDVGSGWFHHDAFLLYLVGDFCVYLFDIEDRAQLNYIRNYLAYLRREIAWVAGALDIDEAVAREKLTELLALPNRASIYETCNFVPCITDQVDRPFLPESSIDFMVSNCVLVHVRPNMIVPELKALKQMLRPDGQMYHMLGHDDHWAFHDRAMKWPSFQYLRYSERAYRLLFDTQLEYHNRIVRPEWLRIFSDSGLEVLEYEAVITEDSRASVRSLSHIASRYRSYAVDELAIIYSYVLLGDSRSEKLSGATDGSVRARSDVSEVARARSDLSHPA